jgi:hypothetical protein
MDWDEHREFYKDSNPRNLYDSPPKSMLFATILYSRPFVFIRGSFIFLWLRLRCDRYSADSMPFLGVLLCQGSRPLPFPRFHVHKFTHSHVPRSHVPGTRRMEPVNRRPTGAGPAKAKNNGVTMQPRVTQSIAFPD